MHMPDITGIRERFALNFPVKNLHLKITGYAMKLLFLSFLLAVALLSFTTGCTMAWGYYSNRAAFEYEAKMLDSLNRLPQFSRVDADTELHVYSLSQFRYTYVLTFHCKGSKCTLNDAELLRDNIKKHITGNYDVLDGIRFEFLPGSCSCLPISSKCVSPKY